MALPGRNFARFLLMLFLLFSLIMRTAYQGMQFELLRKEIRRPVIQRIDELLSQGYEIYGTNASLGHLSNTEFYKR